MDEGGDIPRTAPLTNEERLASIGYASMPVGGGGGAQQPKKKGRGRPRKEKLTMNAVPPPTADFGMAPPTNDNYEGVHFGADPDDAAQAMPMPADPSDPNYGKVDEREVNTEDELLEKRNLIQKILQLKKRCNAIGTGMVPTVFFPIEKLKAEVDVLNDEIDGRRADKVLVKGTLWLVDVLEKTLPKVNVDATGLSQEVIDNWDLFDEACTQIAINHREYFGVAKSPYVAYAHALYTCVSSRVAKNVAQKAFLAKQVEEARLEQK